MSLQSGRCDFSEFLATRSSATSVNVYPRRKAGQQCLGSDRPPIKVTMELLAPHFGRPLKAVAKRMGLCPTALKKACRKLGIERWPNTSKGDGGDFTPEASSKHAASASLAEHEPQQQSESEHASEHQPQTQQQQEQEQREATADGWRVSGGVCRGVTEPANSSSGFDFSFAGEEEEEGWGGGCAPL
eukprot:CAMPEP_0196726656 /NCGR_PEP_ID=MMETSP1091-20130531/7885_1 /TAXON_ID=302021 /ORGANISM="Rhodomonas sp., Strain CCMP768" /LENGTH=186 /DNA_ID=CAMNT_0042069139 /DNA_START=75 /DNA_END=632 /DNA_ORIENTATION=+